MSADAPRPGFWHRTRRRLRRMAAVLALATVLLALALLQIASTGVPRPLLDRLEDRLAAQGLYADFEDVRLSLFGHGSVGRARVYRHGALFPDVELENALVSFRWRWRKGRPLPEPQRVDLDVARVRSLAFLDALRAAASDDARGSVGTLPPLQVSVAAGAVEAFGAQARRLRVAVRTLPHSVRFENIHLAFDGDAATREEVRGELALLLPGHREVAPQATSPALRGSLYGRLAPTRLSPVFRALGSESVPEIFEAFDFPSLPPDITASIDFREDRRRITVDIDARRCQYNGVPILDASARVEVYGRDDWDGVHIRNLAVTRPEGRADADLRFDFLRHGVFVDASSTLDFAHLAAIVDILHGVPWDTYETSGGNRATAKGFYGFSASEDPTDLRGALSAGAFSLRRRVPVRNLSATFRVDDAGYHFPDIRGRLYDGEATARADLFPDAGDLLRVDYAVAVTNASTALVSQDLFHESVAGDPGRADLRLAASLVLDDDPLRTAVGTVSGRVRNARLYQTPLFAGFTDFMARNVPGVDFLVNQDDLDFTADISDNALRFTDLRVEGALFSIVGEGNYWFTDHLDLGIQVRLFKNRTWVGKVLKVALYPVSKLFEIEVTGPVGNPSWTPTTLTLSGRTEATEEQKYGTPEKK